MAKNNVEQAFEKVYDEDYKLIKLWEDKEINHAGYGIVTFNRLMVDFDVSKDTRIYNARSNDLLLVNKYEIEKWLQFMEEVEGK